MPWRPPQVAGEFPTLGYQVLDWVETFLVHGPGDVQGEPIHLDDELAMFILRAYRIDPVSGRRVYDEALLSRPKGRAKSELAGMLACAEALGPVRFSHWDADTGEPIGRPVQYPLVRCLATEEGQSGHTFLNVAYMLAEARDRYPEFAGVDIGRDWQSSSRIFLPGGGEIRPSTASSSAKDGGKESYIVADEPLALDTPIPTTSGWRTMATIQVGDYAFGPDGHPVLVWGVAPIKYDRDCYRVTFDDGTSVIADAAHRWQVFDRKSRHRWLEQTTAQMVSQSWYGGSRFAVAQPATLHLDDAPVPLDPYALGLWLGDGDARVAVIEVSRDDLDEQLDRLASLGFTTSTYDYDPDHGSVGVRFNAGQRYGKSGTSQHALRALGVLGNKHVPDVYLWASTDQRLALLQGLMDSDGYVNERGNCTFTNTNRALIDAVVHLARSLGWRASAGEWQSDTRWKIQTAGTWRVSFTPSGRVPFRLKRKVERCRVVPAERTRAITSIEQVDSVPVRCIAVDSDDHLFLAGPGMLPTHNTHLYVLPELRSMYRTVKRNLAKRRAAEPWLLQTSTMYAPGEQSVAEATHEAHGKGQTPRLLFDHKGVTGEIDLADDAALEAALRHVYGPFAEHMDLPRIMAELRDPTADENEQRRYFLNERRAGSARWMDPAVWAARADPKVIVADGAPVTLGFDGAISRDAAALVGCTRSRHWFVIDVWERPAGARGEGWVVPQDEVDQAVRTAHRRWRVIRQYNDPSWWEGWIASWAEEYGKDVVVALPQSATRMAPRVMAADAAIRAGEMTHDGDSRIARHVANAHKHFVRLRGDDGERQPFTLQKDRPNSPRKIDAAVAGVLADAAWIDASAAGLFVDEPEQPFFGAWR